MPGGEYQITRACQRLGQGCALAQPVFLLAALIAVAPLACQPSTPPAPPTRYDWESAAQAPRPFAWRLEGGGWTECAVVVRAQRPLADDDLHELDAILTDWYNLARLGAFRAEPQHSGPVAAQAMGEPWQAASDTLAAVFDLGGMPRFGLAVLLNALEGYHVEHSPLAEVVLCAEQVPGAAPRRGTT